MTKGEALALMQQGYRSEVRRKPRYLGGDEWLLWPCFTEAQHERFVQK